MLFLKGIFNVSIISYLFYISVASLLSFEPNHSSSCTWSPVAGELLYSLRKGLKLLTWRAPSLVSFPDVDPGTRMASTTMQAETVKVLKEERIPPTEMEKVLSEFLKRNHLCDRISKEDLNRLKALQETLEEEQRAEST